MKDTVCRFRGCGRVFAQIGSRKRHETDQHGYTETKGRTSSPSIFSSGSNSPEVSGAVYQRPQSCPPHLSGFSTHTSQGLRSRSGNMSPESDVDLSWSPNISLTPPSSSPMPRSLFAAPDPEKSNVCPFCQYTFINPRSFLKHKCSFRVDPDFFKKNPNISPITLTKLKTWKETKKIISRLCLEDQVKLCMLNNWAIPSLYPFVFPRQVRAGSHPVPLFETMTASKNSSFLLRKLVNLEKTVKLPKHILLRRLENPLSCLRPCFFLDLALILLNMKDLLM